MNISTKSLTTVLLLIISGAVAFLLPVPEGLNFQSWKLLIIFCLTILGIITTVIPMGALVMFAILVSLLTNTLTIEESFSGFGSYIVWLVVFSFFISKAIIKSNLGKRVAYYFIAKFGGSVTGLSYCMIFTEFLLAPFIPSASARGAGIMYPVAQALADQYNFVSVAKNNDKGIREFLMQICFHTNIITSSMFLTAMAGNPLISALATTIGADLSFSNWFTGAIVPGVVALLLLPFVLKLILKTKVNDMIHAPVLAKTILQDMGRLSRDEIIVLMTFAVLLSLWSGSVFFGIDPTTAALLGFLALLATNVVTWDEVMSEKETWKTFVWFAGFVALSKLLSEKGVTKWIGTNIESILTSVSWDSKFIISISLLLFFYMHYFFASITVYASVMFISFAMLLINLGVPTLTVALVLASFANLSSCLTHYGITSAPIFFSNSKMNVKEWWFAGFLISIMHLLIWSTVGLVWLRIIDWI